VVVALAMTAMEACQFHGIGAIAIEALQAWRDQAAWTGWEVPAVRSACRYLRAAGSDRLTNQFPCPAVANCGSFTCALGPAFPWGINRSPVQSSIESRSLKPRIDHYRAGGV
jgi:hypothetical protein